MIVAGVDYRRDGSGNWQCWGSVSPCSHVIGTEASAVLDDIERLQAAEKEAVETGALISAAMIGVNPESTGG